MIEKMDELLDMINGNENPKTKLMYVRSKNMLQTTKIHMRLGWRTREQRGSLVIYNA